MIEPSTPRERDVAEYWSWFSVGLFLLVTVDLLTTMGATLLYGTAAEANPFVAWLIGRGPVAVTVANLGVVLLAVVAFSGVLRTVRRARAPYGSYLALGVELWLGLLVAVGLFLLANNLSVIVLGDSLL
jgi:membrane-bound metal-dependent hydrolase YbcI (DUF457 family)